MAPLATSITCSDRCCPPPVCGDGCCVKAIDLPSGDQAIGAAGGPGGWLVGRLHVPDVRRLAAPPLDGTTQRCVGSTAVVTVKSSFTISNESLKRSGPVFFSGSSAVANAIVLPSGDHANCCTPVGAFVSACGSPPWLEIV